MKVAVTVPKVFLHDDVRLLSGYAKHLESKIVNDED